MIKPMLAGLQPKPFNDPDYLWEIKYDGIRAIVAHKQIQSRSGKDKTHMFPELEIQTKVPAVLDGEIVCNTGDKSVFSDIQRRNRRHNIDLAAKQYPATLEVIDILEVEGINLEDETLDKRKEILEEVLIPTYNVRIAPTYEDGIQLFEQMKQEGKEGIIGKRRDGRYQRGAQIWLKVKCWKYNYGPESTGEVFLVCGYTAGTGWRSPTFGALVLGRLDGTTLTYVGSVGTGFDNVDLIPIHSDLVKSHAPCPFFREPEKATWVTPRLSLKIKYLEYTNDWILRFPSFKGVK